MFVLVAQIRQDDTDSLARMRQVDLVRLLDELNTRIDDLGEERDSLRLEIFELESGVDSRNAAIEAAAAQERARQIHAGIVPVHGPGIRIEIADEGNQMRAQSLVTVVEELRNAAAEAVEINGVRVVMSTAIVHGDSGMTIDGTPVEPPYVIKAIGDANLMSGAVDMPGGVLANVRGRGHTTELTLEDLIRIAAVAELPELRHAVPID